MATRLFSTARHPLATTVIERIQENN